MKPLHNNLNANKVSVQVTTPTIDHIVIVIEENHSSKKILNNSSAPYMNSLLKDGVNLINHYAIEHPSQPNYLDLFSGSSQGVTNDLMPAMIIGPNLKTGSYDSKTNHFSVLHTIEELYGLSYLGESRNTQALHIWK
jgi:hypothetical protein